MSLHYQVDILEQGKPPLTFNTTTLKTQVTASDGWLGSDVTSPTNFRTELRSITTHRHFEAEVAETDVPIIHKLFEAINRTTEQLKLQIYLVKESSNNTTSNLMSVLIKDVQVMRYHVSKTGYVFAFHATQHSGVPDDWEF